MNTWILLVKLYDQMKHVEDFLSGKLYCNRLTYFQELEEAGRGDPDEGGILFEGVEMEIQADGGEWHKIEGLTGPPRLNYPHINRLNLFCMTAFTVTAPVTASELIDQMRSAIAESLPECLKMGGHAVLVRDADEFIRRVKAAASLAEFQCWRGAVQYYDRYPLDHYLWDRDSIKPVYWKAKKFERQREYRVVLNTFTEDSRPVTLDIGSIRDIAHCVETASMVDMEWRVTPR